MLQLVSFTMHDIAAGENSRLTFLACNGKSTEQDLQDRRDNDRTNWIGQVLEALGAQNERTREQSHQQEIERLTEQRDRVQEEAKESKKESKSFHKQQKRHINQIWVAMNIGAMLGDSTLRSNGSAVALGLI